MLSNRCLVHKFLRINLFGRFARNQRLRCLATRALAYRFALLTSAALAPTQTPTQVPALLAASPDELVGLWKAARRFGPDGRGPLIITREGTTYIADMIGQQVLLREEAGRLSFELPDGEGSFRGRVQRAGRRITGHWTSPNSLVHGFKYASPVSLETDGPNRWRGNVMPRDDTFTLYLMVQKRADGTLGAFLRNPERNIGVFYDVDRIVRDGDSV